MSQEIGQQAKHMTLFQRTPNLCLPMRQRKMTKQEQDDAKDGYPEFFKHRMTTFAGFPYDFADKNTFDDDAETREKFFEDLWDKGEFRAPEEFRRLRLRLIGTRFVALTCSRWL